MQWIAVGKIGKTHGLKGESKLHPCFASADIPPAFRRARLGGGKPDGTACDVEHVRGCMPRLILKLRGCDSIESARALTGKTLYIHREDFPALPEGEYYWFEIEGLKVFDDRGRYHGKIAEILATGGNDVYVVRDGGKELLLPVIESVVKTIDLKEGRLVFHPIEGLLEDTAV